MTTFVLIHGANQGGWIWQPTAARLRAAGHLVHAPSLDGCAERRHSLRPGITTATHATEIAELMFYEDLRDVVLAGTSAGGMVLCRAAELARERIARLVFVDALALLDGERIGEIVNRTDHARHDGTRGRAVARGCREPHVRPSRPGIARLGARPLYAAPDRRDGGAGRARRASGARPGRRRSSAAAAAPARPRRTSAAPPRSSTANTSSSTPATTRCCPTRTRWRCCC